MTKRLISKLIPISLLMSLLLTGTLSPALAEHKTLSVNSLELFSKNYQNNHWLLILWSIECPPCFKELETLSDIAKTHKNLPIVLVNTDDSDYTKERNQIIQDYGLENLEHYYIPANSVEKIKFKIDPDWFGELPRSYFINAKGRWQGHSGVINKQQILSWLKIS